ncbi:hypothetical protein K8Z61_11590 [Nocardioides sp. TRM66260-LWL]|uniref:hypothetical protein n=1 Tax=Nocardioides sp. TRM66260-LWL TaxID=2874478 RepID=UPI001CC7C740|nr:hypothetical protein [Nocardioides sp. TRM66260-LWL]MBZ5735137.1 hypothetical protein [Nocardioides sp. TRM66260-LWL]
MTEPAEELPNDTESVRMAVSSVLDLLGVERVISIDDEHVLNDEEVPFDPAVVVARIQTAALPLTDLVDDPVLRDLFMDADGEVLEIDAAVDVVRGDLPLAAESRLTELCVLSEVEDETPGVVDPEDVTDVSSRPALETLFADHGYQALTLAEWQAAGGRAVVADGVTTLVLVDRDFSREGAATNAGDGIVGDLLAGEGVGDLRCCLLTHSAQTAADERGLEEEIAEANDLDRNAFVVLSKSQLSQDPRRFAHRLLGVLMRQHLGSLRHVLGQALEAGHDAAVELLGRTSDFQLLSMFAAAVTEGAHEPDHLMRPLRTVMRRAIAAALRADDLTATTLDPLHEALLLIPSAGGDLDQDEVAGLVASEMFDSASDLAGLAQPIEPGDIFQIVDPHEVLAGRKPESKYHLILLAQPCEVMVRGTGKRGENVPAHWVLARVKSFDAKVANRAENVKLATFFDHKPRHIKLGEVVHLPVLALDLCVFDPDGYSRFGQADNCPPAASWAWSKHFELLKNEIASLVDAAADAGLESATGSGAELIVRGVTGCIGPKVGMEKQTVNVAISLDSRSIAFGLRRVGHLNDEATRSLLVQATHHQGRPADEAELVASIVTPESGG